jgi:hypothetical protein
MRSFLSIALAVAFTASNWAALTCRIGCEHESQSSTEHSASPHSRLSLAADHAHDHAGEPVLAEPILQAGRHSCGSHVESPAVVSPKRAVELDRVSLPAAISPTFLQAALPDSEAQRELPWQTSFPLLEPRSISLRI